MPHGGMIEPKGLDLPTVMLVTLLDLVIVPKRR